MAKRQHLAVERGVALLHLRQELVLVVERCIRVIGPFNIGAEEAGEEDDAARGLEDGLAAVGGPDGELHIGEGDDRIGHLRGDRALPDEVVEAGLVAREPQFLGGGHAGAGRPDGLVRLLGSLGLGVELLGLGREILVAVAVHDGGTNRTDRLLREVGRVGTHVGDVTVLVELLRGRHRARRRHAELAVGLLLHRAGGEGRIGRVLCLAPLHTLDGDGRPLECRSERLGCRAIEQQRGLGG